MRRIRIAATLAAAAALCAVGLATAGAAQATTPTSNNGAGYSYTAGTGNVVSMSAQLTVPAFSCSFGHDAEGFYPGIFAFDSTGMASEEINIYLVCLDGQTYTGDTICVNGAGCSSTLTTAPGDRLVLSLSETPTGTSGEIYDLTTGASDSKSGGTPVPTSDDTVLVGVRGPVPYGLQRVPTFTKVQFTNVQINGFYPFELPVLRTNLASSGPVEIKTTQLIHDGNAFNTSFAHS